VLEWPFLLDISLLLLIFYLLLCLFFRFFFFNDLNYYVSITSFIMHLLCISLFLFTYYVYVCAWAYFFKNWPTFFSHFPMFMFIFIYLFLWTCCLFFLGDENVVQASPITHPFQKVSRNCHVANVTISPTGGVYCNTCHSKSTIQKLGFFHSSIATNDELVLFTIKGKWLETIVHMTIWSFGFASSKTSSTLHLNSHLW
jgi:hypothetical protein